MPTIVIGHREAITPWDQVQQDIQRGMHAVQQLPFTIEEPFSRLRRLSALFLAVLDGKIARAIELYRQGRLTLGRASEDAGIPVSSFMEVLAGKRIPLHYTVEDLESDRKTAKLLWP